MGRRPCSCQNETRRYSRRSALQATAGVAASALVAGGLAPASTAAQDATPAADDAFDLTGVQPLPLTGERLATLEAYIAAKLAEIQIPGAAVAVIQDGEVVFLQGFGVRQLGRPEPITADTILRIGSVTKSFSSLLAATLVDAGRLGWETPMVDLLPTFAVADPDLTPHHRGRRLLRLYRLAPARLAGHLQRSGTHGRTGGGHDGGFAARPWLR